MADFVTFLDVLFYNIVTPIIISSTAIWMLIDMRKLNFIRKISKIYARQKEKG